MDDFTECSSEDSDDSIIDDDCKIHQEIFDLISNKESISDPDVIEKASRFIFAEDLVSYISLEFHGNVYTIKINKGSENPTLSYSFNETVLCAVHFIRWEIVERNCSSLETIAKLIKSCKYYYENFVEAVLCHYSEKGLTAGMFLHFCVYFAELASICYTPEFEEILDFAVNAILDSFSLFNGGTRELNKFANDVVYSLKDSTFYSTSNDILPEDLTAERQDKSSKDKDFEYKFSAPENDLLETLLILKNSTFYSSYSTSNDILPEDSAVQRRDKSSKDKDLENKFSTPENNLVESLLELKDSTFYSSYSTSNDILSEDSAVQRRDKSSKDKDLENKFSASANDLVESLLQLKHSDKTHKTEILNNIEFQVNNTIERLHKSIGTDQKDSYLDTSDCNVAVLEEIDFPDSRKITSVINIEYFMKELMFVVNSEVSLFPKLHLLAKSLQKSDLLSQNHSENERRKFEIIRNFTYSKERDFDVVSKQLLAQTCFENKAEILIQQETERKSDYSIYALECEDVKLPETAVEVKEFTQDQLLSKNPEDNKEFSGNSIKPDYESWVENSCLSFDTTIAMSVDCKNQPNLGLFVIYKHEGEVNEENVSILKGDSLLFAEDLVRYISNTFYDIAYSEPKFEPYRHCLHNQFSETVKDVAHIIHVESEAITEIVFDLIATVKEDRIACYRKYVDAILNRYTRNGLKSDVFLYYCFHFSELALKLYALNLPEILDYAVCSILDAFCRLKDDWDKFKVAVEYIIECYKSRNCNPYENPELYIYAGEFEKECMDTIIDSLKEITRFRT